MVKDDGNLDFSKIPSGSLLAFYTGSTQLISFLSSQDRHTEAMIELLYAEKRRQKAMREELLRRLGVDHDSPEKLQSWVDFMNER